MTSAHLNAAIYYHPEAYSTQGPKLMGRNAAGESFLRGWLAHGHQDTLWIQVESAQHAQHFARTARALGRQEPIRAVERRALHQLRQAGAVYHPGPGLSKSAWERAAAGHTAWSLCGITHTTSSAGAMDAITDLLHTPVQPWDALICTSTAVKRNVECLLQAQAQHLSERLGAQRIVLPQLPVIPLGIHTDDFKTTPMDKAAARAALGADEHTHVVLFMGRLSFHAKAHPLAMYQALERAARSLPAGQQIMLVECGWHANEHIANSFREAAALACPSVTPRLLDGRDAAARRTAWAAADIFCSLSDNIQETFGITPIEAMAAGMPVVVSDWDGYKDTVRDGVDGFRVPTLMPPAGLGADLAQRHALEIDNYDHYCGLTCALVAVDIEATAQAFSRLMASPELRRRMGEAAQARARSTYDWSAVMPQYEQLWAQLQALRHAAQTPTRPSPGRWPARLDPFESFAGYPTQTLAMTTPLMLTEGQPVDARARLDALTKLSMVNYAANIMLPRDQLDALLEGLNGAGTVAQVSTLLERLPPADKGVGMRSLIWLCKLGLLQISPN